MRLMMGLIYQRAVREMRYGLVRFAALIVAPYWYLKMYLSGAKVRPSDYFLRLLTEKRGRFTRAILFVIVLSIAARSFMPS